MNVEIGIEAAQFLYYNFRYCVFAVWYWDILSKKIACPVNSVIVCFLEIKAVNICSTMATAEFRPIFMRLNLGFYRSGSASRMILVR